MALPSQRRGRKRSQCRKNRHGRISWLAPLYCCLQWLQAASGGLLGRRRSPVPDNAQRWYQKGVEALREGAYLTARGEFNEAVKLFPPFVLAYARLAEADAELDDERAGQAHLLRVSALVPDESRLPATERLRLQAVRALVLRDVDAAVASYRRLAEESEDTEAWLDLGRAQEAAGLRTDARQSYERAISRDGQNAAAYLRLGYVHGLESRRQDALAAFAEAERLYVAASDSRDGRKCSSVAG